MDQNPIILTLDAGTTLNYALQQNQFPLIRMAEIRNTLDYDLNDITLHLSTEPAFCHPLDLVIDRIAAGETLRIKAPDLQADPEYLGGLTERVSGSLVAEVSNVDGSLLGRWRGDLTALAFDEWAGAHRYPELLAAYVTPNHPALTPILAAASDLLAKWTGEPSLEGYQRHDPDRITRQCAALYGALQQQNIVYTVPPASFERSGQRIRLCDTVLEQKMGTCLDLSLLCASALEAMGLHPLLLLGKTHILPAVWLKDTAFPEAVMDDLSLVTKRMADGVGEILAFESTLLTSGKASSFDDARSSAARQLEESDSFSLVIDLHRTRVSGIRPLPMRIHTDDGWRIDRDPVPQNQLTPPPAPMGEVVEVNDDPAARDKLTLWERSLLDLDMRNTLLNLRITKTVLPLLTPGLTELEEALSAGRELGIMARPAELAGEKDPKDPEAARDLSILAPLITSEFENGRLRALVGESDLPGQIRSLNSAARTSIEENGANTLYLALGLLRWHEPKNKQPHYAPLVLLPVEIIRKAANKGYVIRLREEEPQFNISLLEMLSRDFDLRIPGLDPLPRKGDRIDLRTIFAIIRQAVMDNRGWDVVETAFLGLFSFTRFVMWNDLRQRHDTLLDNKVVRSLAEGRLTWAASPIREDEIGSEDGLLLPLPADASQLCAIRAASDGESFVLHGPPGGGKSQTITAIIANALAQGKTVLFVAEKMAALEVVRKRLEGIGLGPFCLELHSNKSRKKDVLNQLQRALELPRETEPEDYLRRAEEAAALRSELDEYVLALHAPLPCGKSAAQLIDLYESVSGSPDLMDLDTDWVSRLTGEELERLEALIERLTAAAKAVGHPAGHPLQYIGRTRYEHRLKARLPEVLDRYETAGTALHEALSAFCEVSELKIPGSRSDIACMIPLTDELPKWLDLPIEWTESEDLEGFGHKVCGAALLRQSLDVQRAELLTVWKDSFFSQDPKALLDEWQLHSSKWAIPRALGMSGLRRKLAPFAHGEVPDTDALPDAFTALDAYNRLAAQTENAADAFLEPAHAIHEKTPDELALLLLDLQASDARMLDLTGSDTFRRSHCGDPDLIPLADNLRAAWAAFLTAEEAAAELLQLDTSPITENWISSLPALCQDIRSHQEMLKEWMLWNALAEECTDAGLAPVVDAYRKGAAHDDILGSWHKTLYRRLIEQAIDGSDTLSAFSGALFSEKLQQFKRMNERMMELSRIEVRSRLEASLPDLTTEAAENEELGILGRAIRSGGRGLSIRNLFEQIPGLLPRLCPCMLMSPLSAAQYLNADHAPFDLVVFDEASQLPTCRAVGALSRGRNAVIVGDPKQMPPTSFFAGTPSVEDTEIEDLESILDDCLAIHMPETHLRWHYRSRHESLIAFVNNQFYEGRLQTFPSPSEQGSRVSLTHVDGVFERGQGRCNRAEAGAIVAELKRRCHDPSLRDRSVGIITFNVNQQGVIEDLLHAACAEDPELDQWAWHGDEPLFIKNLENVQGDERDVILFSVGFGPDPSGKISMNFGPLNREGGWRRLNVAVSRARHEMKVFSTLRPADIDLSRSSAEGVSALRAFLEYAEGRPLPVTAAQLGRKTAPTAVAHAIATALNEAGYETILSVGRADFRVDVGVLDPRDRSRCILGILLDGDSYASARTTRDRELGRMAVLEGLGWNLMRVWSIDWWDNHRKELRRIFAKLEESL